MTYDVYKRLESLDIETTHQKLKERISDVLGDDWKLHINSISDADANKAISYIENALSLYYARNYIGQFNF